MPTRVGHQGNKMSQLRKVSEESRVLKELTSQVDSAWFQVLH